MEKIAALELSVAELKAKLEDYQEERDAIKKAETERMLLLREIWAEAGVIASEKGYTLVIPNLSSHDGIILGSIVINVKVEDITGLLVAGLNLRYSGKK